jgi:mannose-6-phosphate isomerase-like protein (cupin superfamily)
VPGARLGGTPHPPGTRDYFTRLDGRAQIVVAGQRHDLATGDVLAFPGNTQHSYHNPDIRRPARAASQQSSSERPGSDASREEHPAPERFRSEANARLSGKDCPIAAVAYS